MCVGNCDWLVDEFEVFEVVYVVVEVGNVFEWDVVIGCLVY